jgi:hypothetical protein
MPRGSDTVHARLQAVPVSSTDEAGARSSSRQSADDKLETLGTPPTLEAASNAAMLLTRWRLQAVPVSSTDEAGARSSSRQSADDKLETLGTPPTLEAASNAAMLLTRWRL